MAMGRAAPPLTKPPDWAKKKRKGRIRLPMYSEVRRGKIGLCWHIPVS